ncbi:MAG: ABC transporter permease [Candidatus Limnocylindrales bacterium]
MKTLRNLSRRKLRTFLTVSGIAVGIWALVVFGSMGNKISVLVDGGSKYYADKIVVSQSSLYAATSQPLSISVADQLRAIDGIAAVNPEITMMIDDDPHGGSMVMPPMIVGYTPGADMGLDNFKTVIAQGRELTPADEGSNVTVLGSDLARKYNKAPGDTLVIRGATFQVVGVREPTLTAPDSSAVMPLSAAQNLYIQTIPAILRSGLRPSFVVTSIVVYPKPGDTPATVAASIKAALPDLTVMTGADFDKEIGSSVAMLNSILIGIGLISLVVGGLSVINTMAMSVAERTREIGIKRAIGAGRGRLLRELVVEAAVIGLAGGIIGLAFGAVVVTLANDAGRSSGTVLFLLTPNTALTAVAFSTILGAVAGFVPALHAARLDPVSALRYE